MDIDEDNVTEDITTEELLSDGTSDQPKSGEAEETTEDDQEEVSSEEAPKDGETDGSEEDAKDGEDGEGDEDGDEEAEESDPIRAIVKLRRKLKQSEKDKAELIAEISSDGDTSLDEASEALPADDEMPDPSLEPEKFQEWQSSQQLKARLDLSETLAIDKHGEGVIQEAMDELGKVPLEQRPRVMEQKHPFGALVEWYQSRQEAASAAELMSDPLKAREILKAEILEELRAENGESEDPDIQPIKSFAGARSGKASTTKPTEEISTEELFGQN